MHFNHAKRSISLLQVLVMVLSMLPVHAFAAGTDPHGHTADIAPAAGTTDPVQALYQQFQAAADAFLLQYPDSASMTAKQARAYVRTMSRAALREATDALYAMRDQFALLTNDQLQAFAEENPAFVVFSEAIMSAALPDTLSADSFATLAMDSGGVMPLAASGTVLDGQITVTDTASKVTVSGSTVTVSVTGSGGFSSGSWPGCAPSPTPPPRTATPIMLWIPPRRW